MFGGATAKILLNSAALEAYGGSGELQ